MIVNGGDEKRKSNAIASGTVRSSSTATRTRRAMVKGTRLPDGPEHAWFKRAVTATNHSASCHAYRGGTAQAPPQPPQCPPQPPLSNASRHATRRLCQCARWKQIDEGMGRGGIQDNSFALTARSHSPTVSDANCISGGSPARRPMN